LDVLGFSKASLLTPKRKANNPQRGTATAAEISKNEDRETKNRRQNNYPETIEGAGVSPDYFELIWRDTTNWGNFKQPSRSFYD
jgi:hypothetical protein